MWHNHHVRNIKNLNHETLRVSTTKSILCQPWKHLYQWSTAANSVASCSQLLSFSQMSRFYRSVLHVKSRKLEQRLSWELDIILLWLHCPQERVNAQEQQAQPKQWCVEDNQQCFCSDCQSLLSAFAFQSNNSHCITCEKEYQHCSDCDFSQPVVAFQSDLEILQICSTCQEQNSRAKTWSKAQHRVVLTSLSESGLNCPWEHINAQEQQAQSKQQCVENN